MYLRRDCCTDRAFCGRRRSVSVQASQLIAGKLHRHAQLHAVGLPSKPYRLVSYCLFHRPFSRQACYVGIGSGSDANIANATTEPVQQTAALIICDSLAQSGGTESWIGREQPGYGCSVVILNIPLKGRIHRMIASLCLLDHTTHQQNHWTSETFDLPKSRYASWTRF